MSPILLMDVAMGGQQQLIPLCPRYVIIFDNPCWGIQAFPVRKDYDQGLILLNIIKKA